MSLPTGSCVHAIATVLRARTAGQISRKITTCALVDKIDIERSDSSATTYGGSGGGIRAFACREDPAIALVLSSNRRVRWALRGPDIRRERMSWPDQDIEQAAPMGVACQIKSQVAVDLAPVEGVGYLQHHVILVNCPDKKCTGLEKRVILRAAALWAAKYRH
ncbi:hypothetical protein C8R44DRAFT_750755 [Mycena epipterygia]|nr:hypothetical protein C8R44DRAFT_750755 [Mycena epipterygia]